MDVHCSSCGEPWDVHHLWHDAISETSLPQAEAKAWDSLPSAKRLSARYRKIFKESGWEFGRSVVNVMRCPSCPKNAKPDLGKVHIKGLLEGLFGDDEDALVSAFQDFLL